MAENSQKEQKTMWKKGEIARHEQFLLLPLCFQKTFTKVFSKDFSKNFYHSFFQACTADTKTQGYVWERVKRNIHAPCYSRGVQDRLSVPL